MYAGRLQKNTHWKKCVFVQTTPILNVCFAISTPVFVELSCPLDIRTNNCTANFALKIDIDIESLLRLVGCTNIIISYHWIDYARQSKEIKNKNLFRFTFFEIFRFAKKKTRFAISSDH